MRFYWTGICRPWAASSFWHASGHAQGDKPHVIYCATANNQRDIVLVLSSGDEDILKPFKREIRAKLGAAGLI